MSAGLASPAEALRRLLARVTPVDAETVSWPDATGRVLAEPLRADRPSPPCDVSAMDGYAVRVADLGVRLAVRGQVATGHEPPALPAGEALQIFTGGAVPAGADAVVRREDVDEGAGEIHLHPDATVRPGENIRRCGENLEAGEEAVEAGRPVDPPTAATLTTFGYGRLRVRRRVRVALLTTGDELRSVDDEVAPWEIRDSNGPALRTLVDRHAWLTVGEPRTGGDVRSALAARLREALATADALLVTGGVSAGDFDFVPAALTDAGGEVLFHKVAQKPGKPLLGGVGPAGQPVLGLPGNPVSVLVTAHRYAMPALRRLGGLHPADPPRPTVTLRSPDGERKRVWWHRLVRLREDGAELVSTRGSGDMVSAARSDGFIEVPPDSDGPGPWPFYEWGLP